MQVVHTAHAIIPAHQWDRKFLKGLANELEARVNQEYRDIS